MGHRFARCIKRPPDFVFVDMTEITAPIGGRVGFTYTIHQQFSLSRFGGGALAGFNHF
jgi:hypothetical protein